MIGQSVSHWGIHLIPDTEWHQNILFLQDGRVALLDESQIGYLNFGKPNAPYVPTTTVMRYAELTGKLNR